MRRIPLVTAAAAVTALVVGRPAADPAGVAGRVPRLDPAALEAAIAGPPGPGAIVKVTGSAGNWQGVSGVRAGGPVRPGDRFRIGAVSRIFAAAVILQLADEGLVRLDDPVRGHVPDLLPERCSGITVRRLLDHTSGLPVHGAPERDMAECLGSPTLRTLIADGLGRPLDAEPGTVQRENGFGHLIAVALIEGVTGHGYPVEVARRIVRPLRLPGTSMLDRRDMISTAPDLTRFMMALFRGRVVPRPWLGEMTRVPDGVPSGDGARFGLGLRRITGPDGVVAWGQEGSGPGYTTGVWATLDLSRVVVHTIDAPSAAGASEHIAAAAFGT